MANYSWKTADLRRLKRHLQDKSSKFDLSTYNTTIEYINISISFGVINRACKIPTQVKMEYNQIHTV